MLPNNACRSSIQIQEVIGPYIFKLSQNLSHFGSYLVAQQVGNHPFKKKKESSPKTRVYRAAVFYLGNVLSMNLTIPCLGKPAHLTSQNVPRSENDCGKQKLAKYKNPGWWMFSIRKGEWLWIITEVPTQELQKLLNSDCVIMFQSLKPN